MDVKDGKMVAVAACPKATVWNHDTHPSVEDDVPRALRGIDIVRALHEDP